MSPAQYPRAGSFVQPATMQQQNLGKIDERQTRGRSSQPKDFTQSYQSAGKEANTLNVSVNGALDQSVLSQSRSSHSYNRNLKEQARLEGAIMTDKK